MKSFLATASAFVLLASALVVVAPAPAQAASSCSISGLANDSRLASFSGSVTNLDTGKVVFSRSGTKAKRTASVLKLLTATAAIKVLGPDYRLTTKVVAGKKKGTIVLVGGGDATLSRTAKGSSSFYPGAPKLADLAAQVKASTSGKITKIVLDSTYWDSSDAWDSTWKRSEQTIGYLSEVTALQVDGDRANPSANVSHRSTDPVKKAGQYFAKALGLKNVTIVKGKAPKGAKKLASVKSQPMSSLIKTMLLRSDGSLAETIGRVVSKKSGADGSAKSLEKVFLTALKSYGLNTKGVNIRDASGLSHVNAASPRFVTKLLTKIRSTKSLKPVYAGLSESGKTGSLAWRFTGSSAVARGHVLAKTGWIDTEYSLAGIVHAKDGTTLVFAFYAIGSRVTVQAQAALDVLATGVYKCGGRLADS